MLCLKCNMCEITLLLFTSIFSFIKPIFYETKLANPAFLPTAVNNPSIPSSSSLLLLLLHLLHSFPQLRQPSTARLLPPPPLPPLFRPAPWPPCHAPTAPLLLQLLRHLHPDPRRTHTHSHTTCLQPLLIQQAPGRLRCPWSL